MWVQGNSILKHMEEKAPSYDAFIRLSHTVSIHIVYFFFSFLLSTTRIVYWYHKKLYSISWTCIHCYLYHKMGKTQNVFINPFYWIGLDEYMSLVWVGCASQTCENTQMLENKQNKMLYISKWTSENEWMNEWIEHFG